jgi:RNA polymerase sigma factor (sigma-70 family)
MPTGQANSVIRHLCSAALLHETGTLTDGQLLDRFLARRDEAAFVALVRRHGPMVLGVCRRVLGNHADADDAFQATFLVLIRKGPSFLPRRALGNWLYGVAYRTALKARAGHWKRRTKEKQVAHMAKPEARADDPWQDWLPLLDEELSRLPDKYREAVVLCELEGKTRQEAAQQLGVPEGTLSGRLTTARRLLARRLARHAPGISGAALTAAFAQGAASACVPTAIVSSTIKAAGLLAAGQTATGVISAKAAALTEGVLKTMLLSKLKLVTAALLVAAATFTAGGLIYQAQGSERAGARKDTVPRAAREPAAAVKDAAARAPVPADAKGEQAVKNELEKLQGTWILVGGGFKGREDPEEDIQKVLESNHWQKLVISDKNFTWGSVIDEEAMKGTLALDPTRRPKTIDLTFTRDGKTVTGKCIYQLDGDTLKLSYGEPDRPTEFKTTPDSDMPRLYIWKRKK